MRRANVWEVYVYASVDMFNDMCVVLSKCLALPITPPPPTTPYLARAMMSRNHIYPVSKIWILYIQNSFNTIYDLKNMS